MRITQAFVLAAGLGTRMGEVSQQHPKPLLELGGKAIIDYALDALSAYGCERIIVNIHAHADQMARHLSRRPSILISDERSALMGTGGALTHAYKAGRLKAAPFFTHNCDAIFPINLAARRKILEDLASAFLFDEMDGLLLLKQSTAGDAAGNAAGDFARAPDHHIDFGSGYAYTGVQILSPSLLERAPEGKLAMETLWRDAVKRQRLYGHVLTQEWAHVGTKLALRQAEEKFFSPPPANMR